MHRDSLDHFPPSFKNLPERLARVQALNHGARGEVSDADEEFLREEARAKAARIFDGNKGESDPDLDHDPSLGQWNGGTHEDFADK